MQLMLVEQQNKKRLLIARQEQDSLMMASVTNDLTIDQLAMTHGSNPTGERHNSEADLLGLLNSDVSSMGIEELQSCMQSLQARVKRLKGTQEKEQGPAFRFQVLHRILQDNVVTSRHGAEKIEKTLSSAFFDPPEQLYGQGKTQVLRCKIPLQNFDLFLEQNKDISFIVYRTHIPSARDLTMKLRNTNDQELQSPAPVEESIRPVSKDLVYALETILESREEYAEMLQKFRGTSELHAPYLFMYHHRSILDELRCSLDEPASDQLTLFSEYVIQNHGSTYASADSLISQSKISPAYVDYLFKPGDTLLSRYENGYRGWVASSWALKTHTERISRTTAEAKKRGAPASLYGSHAASKGMASDIVLLHHFTIQAWHWDFDGNFQRQSELLKFSIQAEEKPNRLGKEVESSSYMGLSDETNNIEKDGVPVVELNVFPMRFASPEAIETLRQRGKTFWKCRIRRYVSYSEMDKEGIQNMVGLRHAILRSYWRS
jgi:hypothetical protein